VPRLLQSRPLPAATPPLVANRRFTLALTASLLLHALLLALHFEIPDKLLNRAHDSQLEVVLVNSRSAIAPLEPQARAQANLDGGGNIDEDRRAKTPLPPMRRDSDGDELVTAQQRVQQLEAQQRRLLTEMQSQAAVAVQPQERSEQPEPQPQVSGADLAQSAMAMARTLEAQIARQIEEYNKRPRKKFIGSRTVEAVEAQYVEDWRQKVERVGNLNYPEAARGRIYGNLILSVGIRADGELDSVEVQRSSGHQVLDQAARRIVELAAPYGPFPPRLRQTVDILVITRAWSFTNSDRLQSE
jgi:protein TonB